MSMPQLIKDPAKDGCAEISPDGSDILFTSDRDGFSQIYLMDPDGSNIKQITDGSFNNYCGTWSPDGKQIAFTSERDGNTEIYVMNADGTEQVRITNGTANNGSPIWIP
jgi:Tol biopolymer transport system component